MERDGGRAFVLIVGLLVGLAALLGALLLVQAQQRQRLAEGPVELREEPIATPTPAPGGPSPGATAPAPATPTVPAMGPPVTPPPGTSPFAITDVTLSQEQPRAGERLRFDVAIESRVIPHTRVIATFFVGDERVRQFSGVVPPLQRATATFEWRAVAGRHVLRVELTSAAGERYDSWERTVDVP